VVVDIDPLCAWGDRLDDRAETLFHRVVEGEQNVELLRGCRRSRDELMCGEVAEFLQHAILVPRGDVLALAFEPERGSDCRAERIGIRAQMARDRDPLCPAQGVGDLAKHFRRGRVHS
jgi:hypothetical protein